MKLPLKLTTFGAALIVLTVGAAPLHSSAADHIDASAFGSLGSPGAAFKPQSVNGYTVQLVGINSTDHTAFYKKLDLNSDFEGSLTGGQLKKALGYGSQLAGAIVMFDEPTESVTKYARYKLTVNGEVQPGG